MIESWVIDAGSEPVPVERLREAADAIAGAR